MNLDLELSTLFDHIIFETWMELMVDKEIFVSNKYKLPP